MTQKRPYRPRRIDRPEPIKFGYSRRRLVQARDESPTAWFHLPADERQDIERWRRSRAQRPPRKETP